MNNDDLIDNIITCPHCNNYIIIEKLNCGIFRHGTYKINNKQVEPHASKEICENLIKEDLIYGCGKPFQIIKINNTFEIKICDYI
jgi:hypothetical protein